MGELVFGTNPLTRLDYPDPDVIRVGETYYMASTTMYFMPGCAILRSYDLINWEFVCHVYDRLEDTDRENLSGANAYGAGMWAPTFRYHDGVFHIVFIANDTKKTYHFTAENIEGPWKKSYIEGFYHDSSLLFDDDGRVYIMYGNRDIYVTELLPDLSGPKPGGLNKLVISDDKGPHLGYEGCHLYKINGKYYAFFIHAAKEKRLRIEACFMSDGIDGGWIGGDVIRDEFDGTTGVAQGGIVDAPSGEWYGVIFGDRGAVGRIPNLVPMTFGEDGFPKFGKVTKKVCAKSTRPGHIYKPLYFSDDFSGDRLDPAWEFNHNPDGRHWRLDCGLVLDSLFAPNFEYAKNTLTQRALWPGCSAEVTVDGSKLFDCGFAGIAALQYRYGAIGILKKNGGFYAVLKLREDGEEYIAASEPLDGAIARFKVSFKFGPGRDFAEFFVYSGEGRKRLGGEHRMTFDLRHFTGCRFGLFCYSEGGEIGSAKFTDFKYLAAEEITQKLFELADPEYRKFQPKIIPTVPEENILGVRIPEIRKLAKALDPDVSREFLNGLPHRYYDENILHAAILCNIRDYDEAVYEVERFLPYIDNWAVCDGLNPKAFSKNREALLTRIYSWLESEKPYVVRFGIGMLMRYYLDGDFKPEYLERVAKIRTEEYYVNMMIAWYFATALSKQWSAAVKYLEDKKLSPWAHNKAIQKARESFRISKEQKDCLMKLKL